MNKQKIFRPCDQCVNDGECKYDRGCYHWRVYFRAYWKELRRQVLGKE